MFWIYLIIFILAIFVPNLVPQAGIGFLNRQSTEELIIFLLGASGFLMFLWKERKLSKNEQERIKIQKESKMISKNLSDTYLYIGEINRKLDILKQVSLGLPEYASKITIGREKEFFASIIEAIHLLSKSKNFKLIFTDIKEKKIIYEIAGSKRFRMQEKFEDIFKKDINFINKDKYFFISSTKDIENICSAIVIQKKNNNQKFDDPEILEALASQALFLFICSRKKKAA